MSNDISIKSNIHPVTQKLLTGELKLSEITLQQFDQDREIYPSWHVARQKGFEAEHIISVSNQIRKYNLNHNTQYKTSERYRFKKETNALDDRCYRLTPLEHLIRHYLKARENPQEEMKAFLGMISRSNKVFQDLKNITISLFIEVAELKKEGIERASQIRQGKTMKEITENPNWIDPKKGLTKQEITKNPLYVDPRKGKTMKEITKNPDWEDPKKGQKMKDYTSNYKIPSTAFKTGHLTWNKGIPWSKEMRLKISLAHKGKPSSLKGTTNRYSEKALQKMKNSAQKERREKSLRYKKAKETGTFLGTWNEYQKWEAAQKVLNS